MTNENEKIDHFIIDSVFYNVHHESSSNDEYDKNYDDYQNYGNEISDNIMGKIAINFINPSTPSVKPQYICTRCRESFGSRNRFFFRIYA